MVIQSAEKGPAKTTSVYILARSASLMATRTGQTTRCLARNQDQIYQHKEVKSYGDVYHITGVDGQGKVQKSFRKCITVVYPQWEGKSNCHNSVSAGSGQVDDRQISLRSESVSESQRTSIG